MILSLLVTGWVKDDRSSYFWFSGVIMTALCLHEWTKFKFLLAYGINVATHDDSTSIEGIRDY